MSDNELLLEFADREDFRNWLYDHCLSGGASGFYLGRPAGRKPSKPAGP